MQIGYDPHLRLLIREGRIQVRPRTRFRVLVPPTAPSGLGCVTFSSSRIDLSWTDNSSDELGFNIYRSLVGGGPYAFVDSVGAGVTTYMDMGLAASTQYFYVVTAFNNDGESPDSNETDCTTDAAPGARRTGPGKWVKRYLAHRVFAGNRLGDWIQ